MLPSPSFAAVYNDNCFHRWFQLKHTTGLTCDFHLFIQVSSHKILVTFFFFYQFVCHHIPWRHFQKDLAYVKRNGTVQKLSFPFSELSDLVSICCRQFCGVNLFVHLACFILISMTSCIQMWIVSFTHLPGSSKTALKGVKVWESLCSLVWRSKMKLSFPIFHFLPHLSLVPR